ncbi:MAG: chloride channel protein, partial [Bacteroidia bacterium]
AGGIAGAFNSPIAGVLFALEVILIDISITAFIPLLIAAASGALVSTILLREHILLSFRLQQPFNYHNVPFYIVLGILAGFVSLYYVNFFEKVEHRLKQNKSSIAKWGIGAASLAILIAFFPSLFGEGYDSIISLSEIKPGNLFHDSIVGKFISSKWLIFLFITMVMLSKAIAAGLTIGSGGNGGNFAPSLFVGAYLGFAFAYLMILLGFDDIPISNFTIVAMAGILSGVFHAPLTAIFLIAEITGGYELIIPLMLVSSISYVVVKKFHPFSMDVRKLKERGTIVSEDKDTSILSKIDLPEIIEHDFALLHPEDKLRSIINVIKHSKRNTFPVVNKNNKLVGIIQLDSIKEEMFNPSLYDKFTAKELMEKPIAQIKHDEDIFSIMKKFEQSGQWNLPVTENGHYIGFLSKSSILSKYRSELLSTV